MGALQAPTSSLGPFGPALCPAQGDYHSVYTSMPIIAQMHCTRMHHTRIYRTQMHRIQMYCTHMMMIVIIMMIASYGNDDDDDHPLGDERIIHK